jgi:hypothetical protein
MLPGRIKNCGRQFACIDRFGRPYTQTTRCGMIWYCPACCQRTSGQRKRELRRAADEWEAAGGQTLMATFSLRHAPYTPLNSVLTSLQQSYRAFSEGKGYTTLKGRFGITGSVRGLEVTYSEINGWHPHFHTLIFFQPGVGLEREVIECDLLARWLSSAKRAGGYANEYGLALTDAAPGYLSKGVTFSTNPDRRTVWDLAHSFAETGDLDAADQFRAYVMALKGRQQLRWSPALRPQRGTSNSRWTQ